MKYKVGVVSLGCAKNLVDSEVMLGILKEAQFELTSEEKNADILIVNTCGFIESAKKESIDTVLRLAAFKQTGQCKALILAGCLAQKYRKELAEELPEVDAIIGTGEVDGIARVIHDVLAGKRIIRTAKPDYLYDHNSPRVLTTPGYTAYLKVADGCDNCCSYCVIPELRGRYRSRTIESVLAEAEALAGQGVREINLIAQDTTRYGLDLYGEYKLAELLPRLAAIRGIRWIRLLYCYPTHFTDELISVIAATPKVCRYLDIPLQHCDDELLQKMNRRGSKEQIINLLKRLRAAMPDITLRTSFIVGLPGETEEKFKSLLQFIQETRFDRAGVFTYSQEPGTPAANMPLQVPESVKERRYHQAMELLTGLSWESNQTKVGRVLEVLVEGQETDGHWFGRSPADAPDIDGRVYFDGNALQSGDFVSVLIDEAYEYDLMGAVINEPC